MKEPLFSIDYAFILLKSVHFLLFLETYLCLRKTHGEGRGKRVRGREASVDINLLGGQAR
jgi:hypothetical protein